MLEFKPLESSFLVTVNGQSYPIIERDIDVVFFHTADLIDNDHTGSAIITLGNTTVVLNQDDWECLYDHAEAHIQDTIEASECSEIVIH